MNNAGVRVCIKLRRPQFHTPEIIDQGKDRCRVCIDVCFDLHTRVAGQDQPDKDQQDNKTGSSVKKFLHDVFVFDRGARLFHSTMPG